jgi:hypothetical protein
LAKRTDDKLFIIDCLKMQAVALWRLNRPIDAATKLGQAKRISQRIRNQEAEGITVNLLHKYEMINLESDDDKPVIEGSIRKS